MLFYFSHIQNDNLSSEFRLNPSAFSVRYGISAVFFSLWQISERNSLRGDRHVCACGFRCSLRAGRFHALWSEMAPPQWQLVLVTDSQLGSTAQGSSTLPHARPWADLWFTEWLCVSQWFLCPLSLVPLVMSVVSMKEKMLEMKEVLQLLLLLKVISAFVPHRHHSPPPWLGWVYFPPHGWEQESLSRTFHSIC